MGLLSRVGWGEMGKTMNEVTMCNVAFSVVADPNFSIVSMLPDVNRFLRFYYQW